MMEKRTFAPERSLVEAAPKGEAHEITELELRTSDTGRCLVIHTGDEHEDEIPCAEMSRLAICPRDTNERGSKVPLFYPPLCQVLLETEAAEIAFRKMLAEAMVTAGLPMDQLSSEVRGIAATSMEVPANETEQHQFSDLATLVEM